jgi:hypothetical protein
VTIDFERMFSPNAFEAARSLRSHRSKHPLHSNEDIIAIVRSLSPDSYDFDAGQELDALVIDSADFVNGQSFYRHCIEILISRNPIWLRIISLGRRKFVQKLSRDEQNCFEFAGLLGDPPDAATITWWDRTINELRRITDLDVMRRARVAEQMSLEHERKRLTSLGIELSPVWTGFDDNTVGYDILSYDPGVPNPISRLIEVKSTIYSPLRFFITRNEWETAMKFGDRYFFHIWDLRGPTLYERAMRDIESKIPTDNATGRWNNAHIPI